MSASDPNEIFDPTEPPPRAATPQSTRLSRLMREAGWILFLALAAYLVMIFASHHASDPGWFNTGKEGTVLNKGGTMGATISQFAFGVFGLSAWWFVLLAAWAVMRLFHRVEIWSVFDHRNLVIALCGFSILLVASSTLEALRLYSFVTDLPHAAGGVIGSLLSGPVETGQIGRAHV